MGRHYNNLPCNLPQLQNLIKRDPNSYKEEFLQQYNHFNSILEVFRLVPNEYNKSLDELVMFLAQVAQCYIDELITFPQQLVDLLKNLSTTLHSGMRNSFCRAIILLRSKNLIPPMCVFELFFQLFRSPDKNLRIFLQNNIIADISNINSKHKDVKLNSTLQNFIYSMLKDANPYAAKISIDILIELYRKNIWNDAKTVNVIANVGCFSKLTKVMVASLKFFLGSDNYDNNIDESDSDTYVDLKGAIMANKVNKKTKKRKKQLENLKREVVKSKKKRTNAVSFNFPAIHLIHDPQGLSENLFKQLQSQNDRFEVKLMHLDVISRLIGIHDLFLFSFYPYITRFLQPHQRQVTRILQFAAQASHELVPGDIIEPILKTIANNFITETNSSDVMAIGLNAVREICSRCPLAMDESLLKDLALYKTHNEKSVMAAARSLIMLYRHEVPDLLHKKDRGRPTESQMLMKPKSYGEVSAVDHIPGTETLLADTETIEIANSDDENSSNQSDDGDWIDVEKSSNECVNNGEHMNDFYNHKNVLQQNIKDGGPNANGVHNKTNSESVVIIEKKEALKELALTRIFNDDDFKQIDIQNLKKQFVKGSKRSMEEEKTEFVRLDDIEMIYKKKKNDKETRLESVSEGRFNREKFGYRDRRKNENCSKTNKEKQKRKNFGMMRNKARSKIKRSFKEKQHHLRKHLLNQKKMK